MEKLVVALLGMEFTTCVQPVKGVRVDEVRPGLAASREGLRVGDLIQVCHGEPLRTREDFIRALLSWLITANFHASVSQAVYFTLQLSILRSGILIEKELCFRKNPERKHSDDRVIKAEEQQHQQQQQHQQPQQQQQLLIEFVPPQPSPEPFFLSRFLLTQDEPPEIDFPPSLVSSLSSPSSASSSSSSSSPSLSTSPSGTSLSFLPSSFSTRSCSSALSLPSFRSSSASTSSYMLQEHVDLSHQDADVTAAWEEFRNGLGLTSATGGIRGALVTKSPSSHPEGLVKGDLIQAVNGAPTGSMEALCTEWFRALHTASPGVSAHAIFTVLRSNKFLVFKLVALPSLQL